MSRDDLRIGRFSAPGRLYHITVTTEGRQSLFADLAFARLVIAEMRRLHEQRLLESLAWVLMPDHLHWLLRLQGPLSLSQVIKLLKGRSSKRLGERLGTGRRIWQRGFHDRALRREEDLQQVARYIVANPLRAGLVRSVRLYSHWEAVWV